MIRGQKRPLETPKVKAELSCAIHNRFDIEVVDAKSGEVRQRAQAENMILDQLWSRLLAPNTYFNFIQFGTGTGTQAPTRTSLFAFLGAKAAADKMLTFNDAEGWVSSRKQIQIQETEYVGSTITEVGIGHAVAAASLCTHAMLKDMNGSTISIAKTGTDIINIYATVFVHWNTAGYDNGHIMLAPAKLNSFVAEYLCGDYTSDSVPVAATFTKGGAFPVAYYRGNNQYDSGVLRTDATCAYNVSARKISVTVPRLAAGNFNLQGGIRSIAICTRVNCFIDADYYVSLMLPAIDLYMGGVWYEKTSIIGEPIGTGDGVTAGYATAFGFIKAGASVYIDGVKQTAGVEILTNTPIVKTQMGSHFKLIETELDYKNRPFSSPVYTRSNQGNGEMVYYNPHWMYGIYSFSAGYPTRISVSDDLKTWEVLSATYSNTACILADQQRNKKYWKITKPTDFYDLTANTLPATNVVFATPPPAGSVITIDYDTDTIAKDANHVFDLTVEISLGEKTV